MKSVLYILRSDGGRETLVGPLAAEIAAKLREAGIEHRVTLELGGSMPECKIIGDLCQLPPLYAEPPAYASEPRTAQWKREVGRHRRGR
jgi:hypothetical protein